MGIKRGLKPRLAEVGKIKIGGKGPERKGAKGTYRIPVRYDYIVITTTERDSKGDFVVNNDLMLLLDPKENWKDGQTEPKPKEVPILFLFDDVDMNFRTSFAFYQGARCMCTGDGEIATRLFLKDGKQAIITDIHEGDYILNEVKVKKDSKHKVICNPDECPYMTPDAKGSTKCKPSGILSCLIPLSKEVGGVYRFRTHSWNTISNILASLDLIKTITGDMLVGLPMKLKMLKKATEGHGNVTTLTVAFDGSTNEEMRQLAFKEKENRINYNVDILQIENKARNAGFMEDTDSAIDISEEFYTEVPEPEPEKKKSISERASGVLGDVNTTQAVEAEVVEDVNPEPEKKKDEVLKSTPKEVEKKTPVQVVEEMSEQAPEPVDDDGLEIW